jgi:glutaredoxin 3
MSEVTIYTRSQCLYCSHAKALLDSRQIPYEERDVTQNPAELAEMLRRTGGRAFPQIVIANQVIGGYDDLRALDSQGQLFPLLSTESVSA